METQTRQPSITASTETPSSTSVQTVSDVQNVSPALERYLRATLFGDLWNRPDLSSRDRSIVTLAALIARSQTVDLPSYLDLALDHGVTPAEISEIITHLAFYSGCGTAMAAVAVAKEIFARRGSGAYQLPAASPQLLPLDQAAEEQRASRVQQDVGPVSQGLVDYTGKLLFRDLWLRPGLAPRDRSLVTVSALIAAGQVAQIPFHLNRAMDNGLTKAQASEVLTHLAFYAGWPNAMSAVPVVKGVFEGRPSQDLSGASASLMEGDGRDQPDASKVEYLPPAWDWVREQVERQERSGGKEGTTLGDAGLPVIILTYTGRTTGASRKTPLMRVVTEDGKYVLVASKGGAPENPAWYYSLRGQPEVTIRDHEQVFPARVREVTDPAERARVWDAAVQAYPPYAEYQKHTSRQIPVFVAERV